MRIHFATTAPANAPARLRRRALIGAAALAPFGPAWPALPPVVPVGADEAALLDDLEQRSFRFFWETTDARSGLAPDRWPTPSFASIAAVGFALTGYPIGVERGWITREQARGRTLTTLRFFHDAPQGPQRRGTAGHKGFFYHFIDRRSGTRFRDCELSPVDTGWLLAGMLYCAAWFDGADADEAEIRRLAQAIYDRVDWRWAQARPPALNHGWHPESGFNASDWKGYSEAMLLYVLALGSPTRPVDAAAWGAWTGPFDRDWVMEYGQSYLRFPPLFGHQFTHCWIDLRGLRDAAARARDLDYFENSRRATYAQQAYAIANPEGWAGYGARRWGISACDGPVDVWRPFGGTSRRFRSYAGRGMGGVAAYDDGTLAPYAVASSIPFAPEIVLPTLADMRHRDGERIYGRYGFYAFNRSFDFADVRPKHGRRVPGFGWVDTDYLGIEVGPVLAMLANHRSEAVWRVMRGEPNTVRGLRRAGFAGGWLDNALSAHR